MSNCKKLPYFEGLTDETIKQGSDFDPTEGVKAYDGYDEEIEYTYSPQELDTCLVGSQVIQYRASQTSEGDMLPNICIPDGLALALPSICDDYQSRTAERIIHIIKANDPTIYGIPQVTVARGIAFDVLDGVTAVDDNGNPITDITYSGTLDKRVSGDIISIDDGDERYPVKSLEVELEPIQDLNGYDKPWAGGAGKNKLKLGDITTTNASSKDKTDNAVTIYNTGTSAGYKYVRYKILDVTALANQTLTFSAKATVVVGTSTPRCLGRLYDSTGTTAIGSALFEITGTSVTSTFTLPSTIAEGTTFCLTLYSDSNHGGEHEIKYYDIQLEEGTTATSYEPYSNICPISGHTEVNTQRTGVNVWGGLTMANDMHDAVNNESVCAFGSDSDGGYITLKASTPVGNAVFMSSGFKENTQYTLILNGKKGNSNPASNLIFLYTDNSVGFINFPQAVANIKQTCVAVSAQGKTVKTIRGSWSSGESFFYYDECGLFEGVLVADDFEPYDGQTYTTTLGRTVYGGTLDVVSGELVVDRAMVDLGSLDFTPSAPTSHIYRTDSLVGVIAEPSTNTDLGNAICSAFSNMAFGPISASDDGRFAVASKQSSTHGRVVFIDHRFSSIAEFVEGNTGVQLVYELATPQTIQLTPQQVMLLTGDNNVWSDGDVTMVYSVDIPTDGSVTYPLEGEYEITYYAEDKCGNVGTATRTIIVTAPTTNNLLSQNTEDNTESEVTE